MPKKPCKQTLCPNFATYRGYCSDHKPRTYPPVPTGRYSPSPRRIYTTKRWQILRKRKLSADSICQDCGKELATEVHHKHAVTEGGPPWSWDNLESLCKSCHSKRTMAEVRTRQW